MIFISHNSKDKPVVEPIAIRLSETFGKENIFYDSWSIQPGEGIIDKMNTGLENCHIFFFFLSKNSLNSEMAKMEWQAAIFKKTNGLIKFVAIRLDNSPIPAIITPIKYIDFVNLGFEIALRQMTDIIQGKITFITQYESIENIIAKQYISNNKITIECMAQYYLEPVGRFVYCTSNTKDQIDYKCIDTLYFEQGFHEESIQLKSESTSIKLNAILLDFKKNLVPGFPLKAEFYAKSSIPIGILSVMHEQAQNKWMQIPMAIEHLNN